MPEAWVEEATTFKIDNAPGMSQDRKDSSDWRQGYCYQFWRSRNNSYRGDGAFGQYALVLPQEDAVIAITSETPNMQEELNLVWQYLLPAMKADRSSFNMKDAVELKKRLALLKLRLPVKADTSFRNPPITSRKFNIESNSKKIEAISFVEFFHSLDRRLHQLFQDLLVHIVQSLDIQTARAGCELAKFF